MQAQDRDNGVVPSLRSYIESRRDNSGVWPLLDAIEYTSGIDLPDNVIDHPTIKILKQCANDFVAWSNVCNSFNHVVASRLTSCFIGHFFIQRRASSR